MRSRFVRITCILALVSAPGCISARWSRQIEGRDLSQAAEAADFRPGEADLAHCLEVLGAPHFVEEQGGEVVLSWGWFRASGFGLTASVSVRAGLSASFRFDNLDGRTRGLVLFFDDGLVLERIERGYLAQLRPSLVTRRPQLVE